MGNSCSDCGPNANSQGGEYTENRGAPDGGTNAPGYTGYGLPADAEDTHTRESLLKVPLFKNLAPQELDGLIRVSKRAQFKDQHQLIRQGDEGDEFFVLKTGKVNVLVDGNKVASLGEGQFFGEMSLLRDEPRNATIMSEGPVDCLKITREDFKNLGLHTLSFPKRMVVIDNADSLAKPPSQKTVEQRKLMMQALEKNRNLQDAVRLNTEHCKAMVDVTWTEQVTKGSKLIKKGDTDAHYFYIVESGCFRVDLDLPKSGDVIAPKIEPIRSGGSFGELALLYSAPRAASIIAEEDSVVWVIDRKQFKEMLAKAASKVQEGYVRYLDKMSIFECLSTAEKTEVAKALQNEKFTKGEMIMEQGERGDKFYVLLDGKVSVIVNNKEVAQLQGTKETAEFFGEKALKSGEVRAASIKVVSSSAKCLTMDKASFDMLLGPLDFYTNRKAKDKESTEQAPKMKRVDSTANRTGPRILRADLKTLGLLGCGGFGAVSLTQHKTSKEIYAYKEMNKGHIVATKMQKSVFRERDIQMMCDSGFIVKLFETYNASNHLGFLLEVCSGGELYDTYHRKGLHGSMKHAKWYTGSTMYAFDHMHERKIIYRDLKPENLLFTSKGFLKITDMGLAKVSPGPTHTMCGTPDYLAPEVISGAGHTIAVDWWTLGVLTYEFIVGRAPFYASSPMVIYKNVGKGIDKVNFPSKHGSEWAEFVKMLCRDDPADRAPMRKGGSDNLRKSSWYKGFDFKGMVDQTAAPPYKPAVKSPTDRGCFFPQESDRPPQPKYVDDGSGWDKGFETSK